MKKMKSVPTVKPSLFGHIKEMWKGKNNRAIEKADIDQDIYWDTW